MKVTVLEQYKEIPLFDSGDILILGGSSTGLAAAVRAARHGHHVIMVEKYNRLGGTATSGYVCHWPSGLDSVYDKQIIGGFSFDFIKRMKKRNAVKQDQSDTRPYSFLPGEMSIEMDEYIKENHISLHLCTLACAPYIENDELKGVFVENKNGRGLITAKVIIDCTGDGDLLYRLGVPSYSGPNLQPPTSCFLVAGLKKANEYVNINALLAEKGESYGIEKDWGWKFTLPGQYDLTIVAKMHTLGMGQLTLEENLTRAEMEGRRKARAYVDMIRDAVPSCVAPILVDVPGTIGIRQTRQFEAVEQVRAEQLLRGIVPDNCIGLCSNRIDRHNPDGSISFTYLTGRFNQFYTDGRKAVESTWMEGKPILYYGIPYHCLVPNSKYTNLLMAGRMFDADEGAFAALRLQMYLNEMGEAVGEAANIMLHKGCSAADVPIKELQNNLEEGGTIFVPEK